MALTTQQLERAQALRTQIRQAGSVMAEKADDSVLLECPMMFDFWQPGKNYAAGAVLRHDDGLYRVQQAHTAQAHQPPNGTGLLAVYRPIALDTAGTLEQPIPFTYGMDVQSGKYYGYEGKVYLAKADMMPCVWKPGTAGMWQWEAITNA